MGDQTKNSEPVDSIWGLTAQESAYFDSFEQIDFEGNLELRSDGDETLLSGAVKNYDPFLFKAHDMIEDDRLPSLKQALAELNYFTQGADVAVYLPEDVAETFIDDQGIPRKSLLKLDDMEPFVANVFPQNIFEGVLSSYLDNERINATVKKDFAYDRVVLSCGGMPEQEYPIEGFEIKKGSLASYNGLFAGQESLQDLVDWEEDEFAVHEYQVGEDNMVVYVPGMQDVVTEFVRDSGVSPKGESYFLRRLDADEEEDCSVVRSYDGFFAEPIGDDGEIIHLHDDGGFHLHLQRPKR